MLRSCKLCDVAHDFRADLRNNPSENNNKRNFWDLPLKNIFLLNPLYTKANMLNFLKIVLRELHCISSLA
jgi:hypothetical protein